MPKPVDYAALAKKYGAVDSTSPSVDYAALAAKFGGTSTDPLSDVQFDNPQPQGVRIGNGMTETVRFQTPRNDSEQAMQSLLAPVTSVFEASKPPQTTAERVAASIPGGLQMKRMLVDPSVVEIEKGRPVLATPVVGPMVGATIDAAKSGEYTAAALNGIGALTAAHGMGLPKPEMPSMAGIKNAVKLSSPSEALASVQVGNQAKVYPQIAKMPPKAVIGTEDIFRAAAPTNMKKSFRGNMYAAAGDLADIGRKIDLAETKGGIISPDMRVKATTNAIWEHQQDMYQTERAPQIEVIKDKTIRVADNAATAKDPISGVRYQSQKPKFSPAVRDGLRYLSENAGKYEARALAKSMLEKGELSAIEADQLAMLTNQELIKFETMTPQEQSTVSATNPRINGLKSLDRKFSETINGELNNAGQPGLAGYERRYAALSRIRMQLESRVNAVELQRKGLGSIVRLVKGAKDGSIVAGASQAAVADVNIGRRLQVGFKKLADSGISAKK